MIIFNVSAACQPKFSVQSSIRLSACRLDHFSCIRSLLQKQFIYLVLHQPNALQVMRSLSLPFYRYHRLNILSSLPFCLLTSFDTSLLRSIAPPSSSGRLLRPAVPQHQSKSPHIPKSLRSPPEQ